MTREYSDHEIDGRTGRIITPEEAAESRRRILDAEEAGDQGYIGEPIEEAELWL
jgi:hypothetical protein